MLTLARFAVSSISSNDWFLAAGAYHSVSNLGSKPWTAALLDCILYSTSADASNHHATAREHDATKDSERVRATFPRTLSAVIARLPLNETASALTALRPDLALTLWHCCLPYDPIPVSIIPLDTG